MKDEIKNPRGKMDHVGNFCALKKSSIDHLRDEAYMQIEFKPEHVKILLDNGLLPIEVGEWFFRGLDKDKEEFKKWQEFAECNSGASVEDRREKFFKQGKLSCEEVQSLYLDMQYSKQLMICLFNHQDLINSSSEDSKNCQKLFNGIGVDEFGISNCIANSFYHLIPLLENMELEQIRNKLYIAKSCVMNSKNEEISLNYTFPARDKEEAGRILEDYKSIMKGKGLKVLVAYWRMANKIGRFEYFCTMVDVMKLISDQKRQSFFSVKEKEDFWAITKILSLSRLSREKKLKGNGSSKEVMRWIEQPLIDILGGERKVEAVEKYPISLAVRVLILVGKRGFAPTAYADNTAFLANNDIMLAFLIQTRAGQMGKGSRDFHFDWGSLIVAGNLQKTAETKKSIAKNQTRKKIDRLQNGKIIEGWNENSSGICFTPRKSKPKSKKNK